MAVVSLRIIVSFFEDEPKLIGRGENAYKSNRVEQFTFDGTLGIIRGKVRSSLKDVVYLVELELADDGIEYGRCSCPRGQYKCHHMACVLLHGLYNVSKTDQHCVWMKRKRTKEVKTVSELYNSTRHSYTALKRPVDDGDKEWFFSALKDCDSLCGFSWLLAPEVTPDDPPVVPLVDDIIYSDEFVHNKLDSAYFLQHIKVTAQQIAEVVRQTVQQRDCPLWHLYRKGRLTASNFHLALRCFRRAKVCPSALNTLLGNYDLSGVKAIQWGTEMESTALRLFTEHKQLDVQPTGLWLHHSGILGASPDGLIPELNAVVEVKCPYSVRDCTIAEACQKKGFCLHKDEQGVISVHGNHQYWDQIQGQMHLTGTMTCFFVVYTNKEFCIVEIAKDEAWGVNVDNLIQFYVDYMLPHISGSAQTK